MAKWTEQGGKRVLEYPMTDDASIPSFSVDDTGYWVRAALEDPDTWIGKDMQACSDLLSPKKIVDTLSRLSGKQWDTEHWSRDAFMEQGKKMDHELWLNYLAFVNQ